MTIFKSRQVNLDPEPFVRDDGWRAAASEPNLPGRGYGYDPRPEFEPTRDPEPFERTYNGTDPKRITSEYAARTKPRYENSFGEVVVTRFAPRREQFDTPVNPILAKLREHVELGADLRGQIQVFFNTAHAEWQWSLGATPEQTIHARKVLTRLAALL